MSDERSYGRILWGMFQFQSSCSWGEIGQTGRDEFEMRAQVIIEEYKRRNPPMNLPSAEEIEDTIERHTGLYMADDISVTTPEVANNILKLIKSKQCTTEKEAPSES